MTSSRETIQSEILSITNKPRFCFMGYAPPLCIGDDFDKPSTKSQTSTHPTPLRVPYPKRGTGPDACFSSSQPLCIGDVYVDKWKIQERKRGRSLGVFKPSGKSRDVPIIPYVSNPEVEHTKHGMSGKIFILPSNHTGQLFTPKIEYMSSILVDSSAETKPHLNGPPFKSSGLGSRLFEEYGTKNQLESLPIVTEKKDVKVSTSSHATTPFKPPGKANINSSFPGYISPACADNRTKSVRSPSTMAAWRCASVPLLSSPFSSIAMNPMNLFRHV